METLRNIERGAGMPANWKDSTTIALYKGKGDALDCTRYRGLRLLEHGFKTYEKVLEGKLRKITRVGANQFGFMKERLTIRRKRKFEHPIKSRRTEIVEGFQLLIRGT